MSTVRHGKRKTTCGVMEKSLRPVESFSEVTRRAAELGLDLEYESDMNLLRMYIGLILNDQIMQIPQAIRGKLRRADIITYQRRGRNSVLTKRGRQMLHEIKDEKKNEAP